MTDMSRLLRELLLGKRNEISVYDNNLDLIILKLEFGADSDIVFGDTPGVVFAKHLTSLMKACLDNNRDTVKLLIYYRANLNARENSGLTALMLCCSFDREDILRLLLDSGADVDAQNNDGRTALMIASNSIRTLLVKLLLSHGARTDIVSQGGHTALSLASLRGNKEIINLLE